MATISACWECGYQGWFGKQVTITHPQPNAVLTEPKPFKGITAYPVRGTYRHLPKGHQVWLLTQDETIGRRIYPQGFFHVHLNPRDKTWHGLIDGGTRQQINVIAVIAPPTSQEYFQYFEYVGREVRNGVFEPIPKIPDECAERDSAQALVP